MGLDGWLVGRYCTLHRGGLVGIAQSPTAAAACHSFPPDVTPCLTLLPTVNARQGCLLYSKWREDGIGIHTVAYQTLDKEVASLGPMTSETCGDVSKRQGTVTVALSVALTNGHHHLLEQILASAQKIVLNAGNIYTTKAISSKYSIWKMWVVVKGWGGSGMS